VPQRSLFELSRHSSSDAPIEHPSPRRGFLGQLAGSVAALATGALASAPLSAEPARASRATLSSAEDRAPEHPGQIREPLIARGPWDMSWTERLTGRHRQVFDAPQIAEGTVLHQARVYLSGYREVYDASDSDLNAVLVIRHRAIPMILGDAIWERYDFIGKKITKLKDPTTGKPARRNPFLHAKEGDKYAMVWPDGGLDTLISRGVIVLGCNMAFTAFAGIIAKQAKREKEKDAILSELRQALIPGVTLMPSGIFAVIRAEEAGCHYIQST
jgi:hypothetical protein